MIPYGKLRWRCRRGMKELDELLTVFLEQAYPQANSQEQRAFAKLLELQDPQLCAYLFGQEIPQDPIMHSLVRKIATLDD